MAYWNNRNKLDKEAIVKLTASEKISNAALRQINGIYKQAYRDLNDMLTSIYNNYAKETGLDIQKLKTLLTVKETDKIWKTLERQGLTKYIKKNYKARINRVEQLQAQIYANIKLLNKGETKVLTNGFKGVMNNAYYKTMYDVQMGTGLDFSFSKIDKRLVTAVSKSKWSGKNYRDRAWFNNERLATEVSDLVGGSILSGQSLNKTIKQVKEQFDVETFRAERLVRTETNYFHNQADMMAYEELGVDKYVFVATLDSRTSHICQEHDNKVYKYEDKEVGVNWPPLHPNCRSTTRGYLGEETEKELVRRARDPVTGKNETIGNISYIQWIKEKKLNSILQ